ncbi:MAG: AAA family ATPase [Gammaproteobacteria bacterium]
MTRSFLIIVTGLPASGKTTLARGLAARYRVPLLAKDLVKEPLLDALGAQDALASRRLSDASFLVLAAIATELLRAGGSCIIEGNFRTGEHDALLRPLLAESGVVAQVLCRVDERERIARLRARRHDARRHPGHRDFEQADAPPAGRSADAFLDLPGERLTFGANACRDDLFRSLDAALLRPGAGGR